jgi:6,7-dimethyl-8-ribityllumazine synthase
MKNARPTAPGLDASSGRFALVASRFNEALCDRLLKGAHAALVDFGAAERAIEVVRVPGAWEIPLALEELASTEEFDALVALGVVIRGETPHFDFICAETSRGIGEVTLRHRLPIGFGLLTCETSVQAEARAGGEAGNKGREAAEAALEMMRVVASVRQISR